MSELSLISDSLERVATHLSILNDEVGELTVRVAVLENQMDEVLWLQRLVLGMVIVAIVGAVLTLILRKRNNK